jgi:VWFA-related protein
MKKFAGVALVLSATAITWGAGQDTTPLFRTGATLVELTLVATDQNNQPVTDLSRDDITVEQNGKPLQVEFFRFEGSAFLPTATDSPRESLAPGIFTNRAEYSPGPARNVTAIVIDSLNTLPEDQVAVRAQVMGYLRALAPNTRVAVYRLGSRLAVLHDFTGDLEGLRARLTQVGPDYNTQAVPADELVRRQEMEAEHLDRVIGSDPGAEADIADIKGQMARMEEHFGEQLQARRITQTVASLEALGNHLAGVPGRKNLVWISGGVPIMTQGARDRWVSDYSEEMRGLARRLATQGITVYPVQASALQVGMLGTGSVAEGSSKGQPARLRPLTREHEQRIWSALDMLADITGGRAFRNTNDLTAGVSAAASDLRGSYTLAFYVPDNTDLRWRQFDVRVRRPGVRVLHRKGYMALAPLKEPSSWSQAEWQAALENPLGSSAIRLDARADVVAAGLSILLQIAAADLYYQRVNGQPVTDLEIGFGERNPREWTRVRRDGAVITIKENPAQAIKPSIVRFSKVWTIEPDTSAVRLVVRDRMTARFGVLDIPLRQIPR